MLVEFLNIFGDAARLEVFVLQPGIHGVASYGYELECTSNGSDRTLGYFELQKNWLTYFVTPKSFILIGFSVISHPAIGVTHLWKLRFGSLNSTPMPRFPPLRLHVKTILSEASEVILWLAWETLQKSLQVNFLHPKLCHGNPLLL